MEEDQQKLAANLAALVELCRESAAAGVELEKPDEYEDALRVRHALEELGQNVGVAVAAAVWKHYSDSLMASWLTGAETVQAAKQALISFALRGEHQGLPAQFVRDIKQGLLEAGRGDTTEYLPD